MDEATLVDAATQINKAFGQISSIIEEAELNACYMVKQTLAQPQRMHTLSRILPVRVGRSERQVYGYGGASENFIVPAI